MLDNCTYNKVKLLNKMCSLVWFIEKHAKQDAKNANDEECYALLEKMAQDLSKYIDQLDEML